MHSPEFFLALPVLEDFALQALVSLDFSALSLHLLGDPGPLSSPLPLAVEDAGSRQDGGLGPSCFPLTGLFS